MRVLLADGTRNVSITSRSPFRVRDADGNSYPLAAGTYTLGTSLKLRVEATAAPKALPGPLRFTPGRLPLELGRAYRGSIQVTVRSGGLQAVNVVGLEDYVRGVVSQEVGSSWPIEALKAQAVASRAFAVATKKDSGSFDVYPDTRSQVYGGVNAEQFETNAAVQSTEGKILTFRGQPALTYFSASSGGRTASVQDGFPGSKPVPYLPSVADPYDTVSPYHSWGPYVYSAADFAKRLGLNGKLQDARAGRNPSLRVNSVSFSTSAGKQSMSGSQLRDVLGLRSTFFSVGVLALDKPSKPLVYGVGSLLSGTARAISNPRIEKLVGGKWVLATPVDREPNGTFTVAVKATAKASYRVAGSGAASAPVSGRSLRLREARPGRQHGFPQRPRAADRRGRAGDDPAQRRLGLDERRHRRARRHRAFLRRSDGHAGELSGSLRAAPRRARGRLARSSGWWLAREAGLRPERSADQQAVVPGPDQGLRLLAGAPAARVDQGRGHRLGNRRQARGLPGPDLRGEELRLVERARRHPGSRNVCRRRDRRRDQ